MSIKFKDFNLLENKGDEAVYTVLKNSSPVGHRLTLKSFDEILQLAALDPLMEIGWVVPKNYTVIEFKNKELADTIAKLNEPVFLIEDATKKLYHLIVELDGRNTENNILGCGILCGTTISNTKKFSVVPLPFCSPKNVSPIAKNIILKHYNNILKPTPWLTPLFTTTKKTTTHSIELPCADPITDLRKLLMIFKHTSLNTKEQASIIRFINDNFVLTKLSEEELDNVLSSGYLHAHEFFDPINGKFYHDVMGDFLIKEHYIKLEEATNKLFFWNEADKVYHHDDNHLLYVMTKLVPSLRTSQKEEVIEYMQQVLYPQRARFNNDPLSIVFNNGILNLRSKSFKPMDPTMLETIKIKANYIPGSKSKLVDEFFKNLTVSNSEIETLFYEAIGYSMLKTNRLQKAFIMLGGGRNGKSTFLTLLRNILGQDNVSSLSFKDLSNNFRASSLTGKLASLAGDISAQAIQDSDMLKSMIGGDLVKVEQKFKNAYDVEMFATMWFSANKLPRTPDTTDGFYRRFSIIPMKANLSKISKVQGELFTEKLISQDNLDYVATKAAEAIFNVYHTTEDFILPQEVADLMAQYRISNSSILSWVYEQYSNDANNFIHKNIKLLYDEYAVWCDQNHFSPVRSSRFRSELESDFQLNIELDGKLEFDTKEEELVEPSEDTQIVDTATA